MRAGFPHSDISGSKLVCQLPGAFRRLPRPSSPVIAKASTTCTYSLDPITLRALRFRLFIFMVWPKPIHSLNFLHPKPFSYRCLLALHPTKNALRRYNLTHYSTHQFTRDSKRQSHEFPWIAEYFTSSKLLKSIREHRFEATRRYIFPVSPTLTLQIQPLVKNQK